MKSPSFADSQDLHEFVPAYADAFPEDVLQFGDPISPIEDITAVVWELARQNRDELLIFTNVDQLGVDVVTNMFASRTRIARLLGADLASLHSAYESRARNLREPKILKDGAVLGRVSEGDDVDLTTIPLLTHFSSDKAPYITSGVVIAEDPTGTGNMSYHRAMLNSPSTLATSLHSRGHLWRRMMVAAEQGKELPVALVIGGHPLFLLAAAARVPADIDERHVAGGLMTAPLDVVRTPLLGFRVPASADFVLEGFIDPKLEVEEGPFGEFTGYSSDRSTHTLLRVETVLQRTDPMLADIVGGNSAEHLNLSRIPRESEMAQKLKDRFPAVAAVHYPNSGTHFHCYVSVRQRRHGEARQVMLGLLGWDPYLKTVIAVDDDVDITNDQEVLWALATRFQPAKDLFLVDGLPGSALDPSSSSVGTTSRIGLDATRGPDFEGSRIKLSESSMKTARRLIAGMTGPSGVPIKGRPEARSGFRRIQPGPSLNE